MVREMRESDIAVVAQLEKTCFSQPWSEQALLDACRLKDTLFVVYEKDGCVIAYMGIYLVAGEADIANIAVAPEHQGHGIGTELMQKVILKLADRGISDITLEVRCSNAAAIALYRKLGFHEEGIRKNYYTHPVEDGMIMWRRKSSCSQVGIFSTENSV